MQKLEKPSWLKIDEEELKNLIKDIAQQNPQPAKIGLILRDRYGIPTTKVFGKKLAEYLQELNLESNMEVQNAEKKVARLKEHFEKNKMDKKAKHKMQKAQTKVSIVKKYFASR